MDDKNWQNTIFESAFDSFDLDDGFFSKMDSEIKKKQTQSIQERKKFIKEKENTESSSIKKNFYGHDINESNVLEFDSKAKENFFFKVSENSEAKEKIDKEVEKCLMGSLSPIRGDHSTNNRNLSFSSTPLHKEDSSVRRLKKSGSTKQNFNHFEADLFDDWIVDEQVEDKTEKKEEKEVKEDEQEDLITLSQAVELIEEESAKLLNEKDALNGSVDLLTGEVICAQEIQNLFTESFDLPKTEPMETKVEIIEESVYETSPEDTSRAGVESTSKIGKAQVAQRLDFGRRKSSEKDMYLKDLQNIWFSSDDDFDAFIKDCDGSQTDSKIKISKNKRNTNSRKNIFTIDLTDETVEVGKKKKCCRVLESDTTEDSPSPKFKRKIKKNWKHKKNLQGREFIDSEAEISGEVSSDEEVEDGEYEKSFVDEASYCTQNNSADMTTKYLESVKSVKNRPGTFKIPKIKPYIPDNIFSQIPEEVNTDYEIDSFCVNDVDEEIKSELSDLEIAEKILEMEKKKKKKTSRNTIKKKNIT